MASDLSDRIYLVTGSTSGIGLAAAEQLARRAAGVIGTGRSPGRCQQAQAHLLSVHPTGRVNYLVADLSLQSQVRALAGLAARQIGEWGAAGLDGLLNNAGVFTFRRSLTAEGFEMQWAVNHLAPFLLTHQLLPLLGKAPYARVVTVSSGSHYHTRLRWKDLQLQRGYNPLFAYKQSKMCNVLFTAELRRRLGPGSRVDAFAADPGLVDTRIGEKDNPPLARWIWDLRRRGGISPQDSARGVVHVLTEPSIRSAPEIYWKHGAPQAPDEGALDEHAARRLWELSTSMCGIQWDDRLPG
jgi:NAD(P)-dependent dehydrogenase (short-subunit alcohol dehydrogenase family)